MMISGREFRSLLATVLAVSLACAPSQALVSLNDGRDRIAVTGSVSVSGDSNIFATSNGAGDTVYSSSLSAAYTRRAGWIGLNANIGVSSSHFAKFDEEDFMNPGVSIGLTKQSGRTTGAFTMSGARESRADPAVNLRSDSWNFNYGLNFKYPIVSTYTLSGNFGYSNRDYENEAIFASLATYTAAFDLYKILTAERELIAGYRYRFSETSRSTSTDDHSFTLGLSGRLIRGINGSIRGGYQMRETPGGGLFTSWTTSVATSYALGKRLTFGLQLSKDFSTTATDSSVDVLSGGIDTAYSFTSRIGLNAAVNFGHSKFLGEPGRIVIAPGPPAVLGPQRQDTYLSWSLSSGYKFNQHLSFGVSYSWFENWSTLAYADFVRGSWSVNASSSW